MLYSKVPTPLRNEPYCLEINLTIRFPFLTFVLILYRKFQKISNFGLIFLYDRTNQKSAKTKESNGLPIIYRGRALED